MEYGRKLTHHVNILTVGEYLCKTDFDQNKFLKIITESMRARVCVCTYVQDGSNMTGTDLCVNKPHCAAAVRP